jgi:hypothetical protein
MFSVNRLLPIKKDHNTSRVFGILPVYITNTAMQPERVFYYNEKENYQF